MKLQGIFPPIATPFDHTGELYKVKVQHNVEKWNRTGAVRLRGLRLDGRERVSHDRREDPVVGDGWPKYAASEKLLMAGTGMESVRETV